MTQEQLAQQMSVSTITLRKIEAEQRRPSAQIATRLAQIFTIPEEEQKKFLRFARGDFEYAPAEGGTTLPWRGASPHSNLPAPLTSFVGRERELKEISRLLADTRLLTLTGPGGVGKTRLAIETARSLAGQFKDGVCWVDLAALTDADLIPKQLARLLDVQAEYQESLIDRLVANLHSKDMLLVFDNCEHLIKACAQFVESLLANCNSLKVLTTSMETLGLFHETIWHVPSLALPEVQLPLSLQQLREYAATDLFLQRAMNVRPGLAFTETDVNSIRHICSRLDGIPLAIELAAARVKVLAVGEIASRLDDGFSLLTSGSRTAIPRHQTLSAAIDWSHDLLTQPEQILLRRLSMFAGGFTLKAVESVCGFGELKGGEILDLLGRLVDKSLVIADQRPGSNDSRYRLLETIRQYAIEKLSDSEEARELRDRHLDFFEQLANHFEQNFFGREGGLWLKRIDLEFDNLRASLDWAMDSGSALAALRTLGSLTYFSFQRGHTTAEWHDRIQRALSSPAGTQRSLVRAKALNSIGYIMSWGSIPHPRIKIDLEEALSIGRQFEDTLTVATALRNLGLLENNRGNYSGALTFLEQSREVLPALGTANPWERASTLAFLGDAAMYKAADGKAREHYMDAINIMEATGDKNLMSYVIRRLAQLELRQGNFMQSERLCRKSLDYNLEVNDLRGVLACLAGYAAIGISQARLEYAAGILAYVDHQLTSLGMKLAIPDRLEFERNLAKVRSELETQLQAPLWVKGAAMTLEDTIDLVLEGGS